MIPPAAHEYLSGLRFDPQAERRCCMLPLGGIYWTDEIPTFDTLLRIPEEERRWIYRLFAIRFRLWAKDRPSSDDDIFWSDCVRAYPNCPILRRTALNPEDQKAQDDCVAGAIEGFEALFSGADRVEVKDGSDGMQSFSATFDLTKERFRVPFWKRAFRRWLK